jgi:O-antigen ligase
MATRLKIVGRQPGGEGPLRSAGRRLRGALWGTNLRRTLTASTLVLLAVISYFLLLRGSAARLLQLSVFLALFLVIITKPQIGIVALRVYRSFARGLRLEHLFRGLGVTLTKSIGLFTFIGFIALVVTKKEKIVFGHKTQLVFLYGFLLATLISAFRALAWAKVWTATFQLLENIILYIIFINLFAEAKWFVRYTWFFVLSLLVSCFTGIGSIALSGVVRAAGAMGNANGLAMVANFAAAMLLVLSLAVTDAKKRFLFLCGLGTCLVTIIFTGSRGGLLTIIITFTYQLIKRRKKLIPYLLAASILVFALVLIPEQYKGRQEQWFGALFAGETEEVLGGTRGFIYRSALDIFKKSPIIGVGPRTFGTIYQAEYAGEARGPALHTKAVHSGLLEVLVSTGVVGFCFFLGLMIATYRLFRENERLCRGAGLSQYLLLNGVYEALFIATIVAGSFETILRGGQTFFVAIAAAAAVNRAAVSLSNGAPSPAASAPLPAAETAGGAPVK